MFIKLFTFLLPFIIMTQAQSFDLSDLSSIVDSYMEDKNKLKEKINQAGKQRMLTQKISKLSLLIEKNIKKKKNIKKLKNAGSIFSKNLKELSSEKSQIKKQLDYINSLWKPFYANIQNIIKNKNIKKSTEYIIKNNERLLKESNNLVKLYEESDKQLNYLDKAKLHIVNLAGRQRMLLEKMGKEKLLTLENKNNYDKKLKSSITDFEKALRSLRVGDQKEHIPKLTNPKLIKKLNIIEPLWKKIKSLYLKESLTKKEIRKLILKSSLIRLEYNIYVKLAELEIEY